MSRTGNSTGTTHSEPGPSPGVELVLAFHREARTMAELIWGRSLELGLSMADSGNMGMLGRLRPRQFTPARMRDVGAAMEALGRWADYERTHPPSGFHPDRTELRRMMDRASAIWTQIEQIPLVDLPGVLAQVQAREPMENEDLFYQLRRIRAIQEDLWRVPATVIDLAQEMGDLDPIDFDRPAFERLERQAEDLLRELEALLASSQQPSPYAPISRVRELDRVVTRIRGILGRMRAGDYGPLDQVITQARAKAIGEGAKDLLSDPLSADQQADDPAVVFVGHGRSPLWRELKDYLEVDLGVTTLYFEQGSHVGEYMAEILSGFFDAATAAVLVLTGDDATLDGKDRARQNVVHEVGYFQGRLGFKRVAMLVQDGVEEFSNVHGIQPVRFPDRQIKQGFSEIHRWLKREGIVQ